MISKETAQAFKPLQLKPVITNAEHSVKRSDKWRKYAQLPLLRSNLEATLHNERILGGSWLTIVDMMRRRCLWRENCRRGQAVQESQKFDRKPLIFVGKLVMPRTNQRAECIIHFYMVAVVCICFSSLGTLVSIVVPIFTMSLDRCFALDFERFLHRFDSYQCCFLPGSQSSS